MKYIGAFAALLLSIYPWDVLIPRRNWYELALALAGRRTLRRNRIRKLRRRVLEALERNRREWQRKSTDFIFALQRIPIR